MWSSFASASDDSCIIIWDIRTGKKLKTLSGHSLPVTCLLMKPGTSNGESPVLISGSSDKTIRVRFGRFDFRQTRHSITRIALPIRCGTLNVERALVPPGLMGGVSRFVAPVTKSYRHPET